MSKYLGTQLTEINPKNFPKKYDMVSHNEAIVGDAKFLKLVHKETLPPAKFRK